MISMLLEETSNGNSNGNVLYYILIAVVALLLIAMPIMMNARNKRETQKVQEQTNSLKVGDKVLTTSGVYGTIVALKFDDTKKVVVLETGETNKSYLSVDAYAIYTVFKSDEQLKKEAEAKAEAEQRALQEAEAKKQAKKSKNKTPAPEKVEEVKVETATKKSGTSKKTNKKEDK